MTNFEWLKSDDERLHDVIKYGLAVNIATGKIEKCSDINCGYCSFNGSTIEPCQNMREAWLNKEHQQLLYKKGDIIVAASGYLYYVISETQNNILVNDKIDGFKNGIGFFISKDYIKQTVGSIKEVTEDDNN